MISKQLLLQAQTPYRLEEINLGKEDAVVV